MLDRKGAFQKMKAGEFSIEFCTLDTTLNTGGKKETLTGCTIRSSEASSAASPFPKGGKGDSLLAKKLPNHRENLTLNLLLPGGQFRKVHVPLILKINGESVL